MILNNMTNFLKNLALVGTTGVRVNDSTNSTSTSYIGPLIEGLLPVKDCKGNEWTQTYASTTREKGIFAPFTKGPTLVLNPTSTSTSNMYYTSVGFGSGSTPVQATDYSLEAPITIGLSTVSGETSLTYSYEVNEDSTEIKRISIVKVAIKNTGTSDITIGEIGFYQSMYTTNYMLLHREVFEPMTLAIGAIATFEFAFEFTGGVA